MGSNAVDILMGGGQLEVEEHVISDHEASDQEVSVEQNVLSNKELPASSYSPIFVSQHSSPVPSAQISGSSRLRISVVVPARNLESEYEEYHEPVVINEVVAESRKNGNRRYRVQFTSGESLWVRH